MNIIGAGRCLLLREAPHQKPHLWFVLTDPIRNPPKVLAVMLRTSRRFTDDTLILQKGDHPFVRHPSSVHCSTARWFSVTAIQRGLIKGHCHVHVDMEGDLLQRVRQAVLDSPFTVQAIKSECKDLFR